jgi:hypothetical protein
MQAYVSLTCMHVYVYMHIYVLCETENTCMCIARKSLHIHIEQYVRIHKWINEKTHTCMNGGECKMHPAFLHMKMSKTLALGGGGGEKKHR